MEIGEWSLVLALLVLGTVLLILLCGQMGASQPGTGGRIVLRVKNCETTIEGVARSLLPHMKAKGWQMTLIDAGSDDDTPVILQRLNRALPGVEVFPFGTIMQEKPLAEVQIFNLQDSREGCRLVQKALVASRMRVPSITNSS